MDPKEVMLQLNFTTKFGITIHSCRKIKNLPLYKHLVLKNLEGKVYIDYANDDYELINLSTLFQESTTFTNKSEIDAHLESSSKFQPKAQYDLFNIIDLCYNDLFGYNVCEDPCFPKFQFFFRQFVEICKSLLVKYQSQVGTKNVSSLNDLLLLELGEPKFNELCQLMMDPVYRHNDITTIINSILCNIISSTGSQTNSSYPNHYNNSNNPNIPSNQNIPLHNNAVQRMDKPTNVPLKENIVISVNECGFLTFKNLIFDAKTSNVIGHWNSVSKVVEPLEDYDILICKQYNLKFIPPNSNTNSNSNTNFNSNTNTNFNSNTNSDTNSNSEEVSLVDTNEDTKTVADEVITEPTKESPKEPTKVILSETPSTPNVMELGDSIESIKQEIEDKLKQIDITEPARKMQESIQKKIELRMSQMNNEEIDDHSEMNQLLHDLQNTEPKQPNAETTVDVNEIPNVLEIGIESSEVETESNESNEQAKVVRRGRKPNPETNLKTRKRGKAN